MFIVGLDLGQAKDYTALCIVEKLEQEGGAIYYVRRLERTRGTSYPDVVKRVEEILGKLSGACDLVVDQTGVGQPVFDMFTKASLKPLGVQIHGGDRVTNEGRTYRVPKRDLVGVLQVLLQNQRLKITPGPLSDTLATEMLNFMVKIDPATAHDSYSAWREAYHDDLVLSVGLACWWGENRPKPTPIIVVPQIPPEDLVTPAWQMGSITGLGQAVRRHIDIELIAEVEGTWDLWVLRYQW